MRILVLGRNPSKKNCDPNIPFAGARCYKTLVKWLKYLSTSNCTFILGNCSPQVDSVFNKITINTYALGLRNKYRSDSIDRVVALGNDAAKVCEVAGLKYFKLPHPSGLNRSINDRVKVLEKLMECSEWLNRK